MIQAGIVSEQQDGGYGRMPPTPSSMAGTGSNSNMDNMACASNTHGGMPHFACSPTPKSWLLVRTESRDLAPIPGVFRRPAGCRSVLLGLARCPRTPRAGRWFREITACARVFWSHASVSSGFSLVRIADARSPTMDDQPIIYVPMLLSQ
jgi:hypothetical protein